MLKNSLALAAALAALPAFAATTEVYPTPVVTQDRVIIDTAPPPDRYEVIPAPREGYVWAPGYWNYQNGGFVWIEGRYVPDQAGTVYYAPRWTQQSDGRYTLFPEQRMPNPLGNKSKVNPLQPSPGQ